MCREHDGYAAIREDSVNRVPSAEYRVPRRWRFFSVLGTRYSVLICFLLLCANCGYHTAGHGGQLPENVKTIAVPAFKNETPTYHVEELLTAAVIREFHTRTQYRILNIAGDDADATLTGTVLSTAASPLAYDTSTGRAASVMVIVSLKVTLVDRRGKVLYQNPAYLFREQYEVSQDLNSFFQEDSPASRRLSEDFARTLVSNILEGF